MRWAPDKGSARPGAGSSASKEIAEVNSDGSDNNLEIDRAQMAPRHVRPDELPALRALWWRQAGLGHHLPPEIDVIVIPGGAV